MERGLIIPSSVRVSDSGLATHFGEPLSPELLRQWLLLWDRFDCPSNNLITTNLSPDLEYLESLGLLQRSFVRFSEARTGELEAHFLSAQERTYKQLSAESPGVWALASHEELISGDWGGNTEPTLVFELGNALQVPTGIVPIEEILEFKRMRRDELTAIHLYLEEFYQKIMNSNDVPRTKSVELARLEQALRDHNAALAEQFPNRAVRSLRAILDRSFVETAAMGMSGAGLAATINLPMVDFGVYCAAATFVVRNVLRAPGDEGRAPLSYISSANRLLL